MVEPSNANEKLALQFKEEKRKTQECLDGVRQLLSYKAYITRRQLIQVLQERIDLIRVEIGNDQFFAELEKVEEVTLSGVQPETFQLPGVEIRRIPGGKIIKRTPPLVFTRDHSAHGVVYKASIALD